MSESSVDWLAVKPVKHATQQQFMRHRFLRSIQAQAPLLALVGVVTALWGFPHLALLYDHGTLFAQVIAYLVFMAVGLGIMMETWQGNLTLKMMLLTSLFVLGFQAYAFISSPGELKQIHVFDRNEIPAILGQMETELLMSVLIFLGYILYRIRQPMWSHCLLIVAFFMPMTDLLATFYRIPDAYAQISLMTSISGMFCAMALLSIQMSQTSISYLFLLDDSGSHLRLRIYIMFVCAIFLGGLGVIFKHDPKLTPALITLSLIAIVCTMTITYYRKGVVHEQVLPPEDLAFASELESAIAHQQFYLVYQPQIDFQSGKVIGVEALIRWQHPQLGVVSPVKFIGVAELTGLIVPMGAWVLSAACQQAASWVDPLLGHVKLSVNVSPLQLRSPGFVDYVLNVLHESGFPAERLVIELTESAFVHSDSHGTSNMQKLKQAGVKLAIDDFGTGYSCLAYLKDIPGDYLKVDRSFVRELPGKERSEAVTRAIVALGKSLHYQIVAEGVETEEQAAFLKTLGCDFVQGFLYAKPMPADALQTWLHNREVV